MRHMNVSTLKILAPYPLSTSRMDDATREMILLGPSAIFWCGFALPMGAFVGIIQVVLLILSMI